MKDQLNTIGIGFKPAMSKAFPKDTAKLSMAYGKDVVQDLFRRRNEIVHQDDHSHASAEQADITKEFVNDCIGKIESIVNAIHGIAEEKDIAET